MAVKGWHGYGAGIVRRRRGMVMPAVSPWKWRGTPPHRPGRVSSPGKPVKTATCCVTRSLPFSLSFALLLSLSLFRFIFLSCSRFLSFSLDVPSIERIYTACIYTLVLTPFDHRHHRELCRQNALSYYMRQRLNEIGIPRKS